MFLTTCTKLIHSLTAQYSLQQPLQTPQESEINHEGSYCSDVKTGWQLTHPWSTASSAPTISYASTSPHRKQETTSTGQIGSLPYYSYRTDSLN